MYHKYIVTCKHCSDFLLQPSAVINPPKKKKPCHCIRPVHVGLVFTVIVIIGAVITPLTLIKSSRDNEFAIFGYHFDYVKRILDIYPWTDATDILAHHGVIFKVGLRLWPILVTCSKFPYNCKLFKIIITVSFTKLQYLYLFQVTIMVMSCSKLPYS